MRLGGPLPHGTPGCTRARAEGTIALQLPMCPLPKRVPPQGPGHVRTWQPGRWGALILSILPGFSLPFPVPTAMCTELGFGVGYGQVPALRKADGVAVHSGTGLREGP